MTGPTTPTQEKEKAQQDLQDPKEETPASQETQERRKQEQEDEKEGKRPSSKPYTGKNKHTEIAEVVTEAMAAYDRQHGFESRPWSSIPANVQKSQADRVKAILEGGYTEESDRFDFEQKLVQSLGQTTEDKDWKPGYDKKFEEKQKREQEEQQKAQKEQREKDEKEQGSRKDESKPTVPAAVGGPKAKATGAYPLEKPEWEKTKEEKHAEEMGAKKDHLATGAYEPVSNTAEQTPVPPHSTPQVATTFKPGTREGERAAGLVDRPAAAPEPIKETQKRTIYPGGQEKREVEEGKEEK